MPSRQRFHQAYLARNREICELLEAGNVPAAERALTAYLDDAERELVTRAELFVSTSGEFGDLSREHVPRHKPGIPICREIGPPAIEATWIDGDFPIQMRNE